MLKRVCRSKTVIIVGGRDEVSTGEELTLEGGGALRYFRFDISELSSYKRLCAQGHDVALGVADLKELVYACNIGVKYVLANKEDAVIMQKIVDSYLFDTKLLAIIYEEDEIEWAAASEIDGVVFDTDERL